MSLREEQREFNNLPLWLKQLWEYNPAIARQAEKLLHQERQAKEELLGAVILCKEIIKKYVTFNMVLMDSEDKEKVKKFDDKLEQLINEHTERDKEIEG